MELGEGLLIGFIFTVWAILTLAATSVPVVIVWMILNAITGG